VPSSYNRSDFGQQAGYPADTLDPRGPAQQLRAARGYRLAPAGSRHRAARRLRRVLRPGAAQPLHRRRQPLLHYRAGLHQPRRLAHRDLPARLSGLRQRRAQDHQHSAGHQPLLGDAVQHAETSPWSPPALELRAFRSYIGTKYSPGRVGLQHEPAAPDGNLTSASRAPSRSIRTSTTTPTAPGPIHSATVQVTRHAPRAAGFGRASIPWGARIGDLEKGAFAREPLDRKREGPCGRYSNPPWKPPALGIPIGKGKHFLNGLNRWQTPHPGWMEVNAIYTRSRATFLTPFGPTRSHRTAYTASSTPATVTYTADTRSATPIFPAARDSRPVVRRERSSPRPRRGPSHLAKA